MKIIRSSHGLSQNGWDTKVVNGVFKESLSIRPVIHIDNT